MKHSFKLSIALDFYLFLGYLISNFVAKMVTFCFSRWNLFSFVSHLVLKTNRTDRQASADKMCPRKAARNAAKQQGSTT